MLANLAHLQPGVQENEEAPAELDTDPSPKEWPSEGRIEVSKAVMRYRKHLPVVLKSISFDVDPGAHIGIVGRTGSGKSSLFLVFFRMIELEGGSISIDGRDISTLGLTTLRRGLSMIPQDPFMFSGTVRRNLDPFGQHSDSEVWEALEQVRMVDSNPRWQAWTT
jgi:ABC-type multidrug transport system fused ATPase/permease subunit